jgi:hypothetical protein
MQIVSTFYGRAQWESVCECLDETGWVTLHASSEHLEVLQNNMQSVSTFFGQALWGSLCECERALAKPVPPPTQHYLSMAYMLPRPGGLGKIYRWGRGDLQYSTSKCFGSACKVSQHAARVRRGGGGLTAATICSQSPGKIHHISSFPIMRHLVWPLGATYGSCFLTCLVFHLKNHIKDEFLKNAWSNLERRQKASGFGIFFQFFYTLWYFEQFDTPGGD